MGNSTGAKTCLGHKQKRTTLRTWRGKGKKGNRSWPKVCDGKKEQVHPRPTLEKNHCSNWVHHGEERWQNSVKKKLRKNVNAFNGGTRAETSPCGVNWLQRKGGGGSVGGPKDEVPVKTEKESFRQSRRA